MGGSGSPSVPARLQHAESTDPQKELELPSFGLQFQSEASQNSYHKGKKEVQIWKCFPSLSGDSATHKAGCRFPCAVQTG